MKGACGGEVPGGRDCRGTHPGLAAHRFRRFHRLALAQADLRPPARRRPGASWSTSRRCRARSPRWRTSSATSRASVTCPAGSTPTTCTTRCSRGRGCRRSASSRSRWSSTPTSASTTAGATATTRGRPDAPGPPGLGDNRGVSTSPDAGPTEWVSREEVGVGPWPGELAVGRAVRPGPAARRRPPQRRGRVPLLAPRGDRGRCGHAGGTRSTSRSRTSSTTTTSARWSARRTPSRRRRCTSSAAAAGTAAARW